MYCSAAGNDIDKSDRQFLSISTLLLLQLTALAIQFVISSASEMKILIWSTCSLQEYKNQFIIYEVEDFFTITPCG